MRQLIFFLPSKSILIFSLCQVHRSRSRGRRIEGGHEPRGARLPTEAARNLHHGIALSPHQLQAPQGLRRRSESTTYQLSSGLNQFKWATSAGVCHLSGLDSLFWVGQLHPTDHSSETSHIILLDLLVNIEIITKNDKRT